MFSLLLDSLCSPETSRVVLSQWVWVYIAIVLVWRSEENWQDSVLHHVGSRDQIQVDRLGGKCLYSLNYLASPINRFLQLFCILVIFFLRFFIYNISEEMSWELRMLKVDENVYDEFICSVLHKSVAKNKHPRTHIFRACLSKHSL